MSILVLTSDTLIGTPATGNLEYNGQFYGTDSNASRAQLQRITQGTAVASTSGTSIDFTGIPAWVKRITLILDLVSTNGTSNLLVQIGNGSVINTGYTSLSLYAGSSSNTGSATTTSGCLLTGTSSAATQAIGSIQLTLQTANTWVLSGTLTQITLNAVSFSDGRIALGGTLDRVRITTVNGTDTFDGGSINIIYEG
jgi:hypothetical protein